MDNGMKSIIGIDLLVLSARQPRFVTSGFQRQFGLPALVTMTISSAVDRRQRRLDAHRRQNAQTLLADGAFESIAADA
jgi:hypothetical protein